MNSPPQLRNSNISVEKPNYRKFNQTFDKYKYNFFQKVGTSDAKENEEDDIVQVQPCGSSRGSLGARGPGLGPCPEIFKV